MFLLTVAAIAVRALGNLLDGMVAEGSGKASPFGELFNEIPDRVSDMAILVGAGYAAGGNPMLGFVVALTAVFVAYVRAEGKYWRRATLLRPDGQTGTDVDVRARVVLRTGADRLATRGGKCK